MLIDYQELSPVKRSVEVEIPAEAVRQEMRKVTSEFGRQARIPGFRPGKIPEKVVKNRFMKEIQEEVVERLLPRFFQQAVVERNEQPVGNPELKRMDDLADGEAVKFLAEFEVKPKIELGDYKRIEIDEPLIEITEREIDAVLDRYREQSSFYRAVTDRPAEKDDFVILDMLSNVDGTEIDRSEGGHVRLGEGGPLPELHEVLTGKSPGDRVTFSKSYLDDAAHEAFRGRTVEHQVTIKEIRIQEKPELSDEFARSVGTWQSVEEMKAKVADDLKKHREQEASRAKRQQLGDVLLSRHEFQVPDVMVEEELGRSLQNYARFLASQQVDLDKADIDWIKLREEFRPEAVKRVKRGLLLEEIARKEDLIISDVEVDAEIRKAAHENRREFAEVKHRLKHDGGYEGLRTTMSQEKALEVLLADAVMKG